jgi:hypothetical protein
MIKLERDARKIIPVTKDRKYKVLVSHKLSTKILFCYVNLYCLSKKYLLY